MKEMPSEQSTTWQSSLTPPSFPLGWRFQRWGRGWIPPTHEELVIEPSCFLQEFGNMSRFFPYDSDSTGLASIRPCKACSRWGVSIFCLLLNGQRKSVSHSLPENQGGDPIIATKKTFLEHRNTEADWGIPDLESIIGMIISACGATRNTQIESITKKSRITPSQICQCPTKIVPKHFLPQTNFYSHCKARSTFFLQKKVLLKAVARNGLTNSPANPTHKKGEGKMISVLQDALHKPEKRKNHWIGCLRIWGW